MIELVSPISIGNLKLKHRIVMAPLTRYRADGNHVPSQLMAEYYGQRAEVSGTLLILEATFVAPQAGGFSCAPEIYNKAQIDAWRKVTDAKLVSSGDLPISKNDPVPEPLTEEEIHAYISYYGQAARNALEAGFDGVEIHGANGYLIDQFLQDTCNNHIDSWGGSVENRAKFGIKVATAVSEAIGAERVGYRMSPYSPVQGMKMDSPVPHFSYLAQELKKLNLAYLHVVDSRISGARDIEASEQPDFLVDIWSRTGAIILAGGFTPETAVETVKKYTNANVAIAFGRHFLANPDLPFRISKKIELHKYNRDTFYVEQSPIPYIDYPFSLEFQREAVVF